MHPVAFILAVAAAIVFVVAAVGSINPRLFSVPVGLALTVVAWIVQLTMETSDPVTF